jgi:hypothetical protein
VGFIVGLHELLVKMRHSVEVSAQLLNGFVLDSCGEERAKSVPPITYGFMRDVDPGFIEKILHM